MEPGYCFGDGTTYLFNKINGTCVTMEKVVIKLRCDDISVEFQCIYFFTNEKLNVSMRACLLT